MLKARQLPRRILTRLETRDKVHRASQHAIVVECVNRPLFRLVRNFLAPESVDTGQECCNAPNFLSRDPSTFLLDILGIGVIVTGARTNLDPTEYSRNLFFDLDAMSFISISLIV